MDKKFNIHEWQANQKLKHYLAEQEDFTPDLEDDELKRRAIQQMMSTEKGPQKDDYKLVNSVSNIADVYSYGEILDALESFYTKNDEQQSAEIARKHAKEFRDFLDTMDKYEKRYGEEDEYDALTPTSDNPDPEGYGDEELDEHHGDENFPKQSAEMEKFLTKLKRANKKVYNQVEDIIRKNFKKQNEASVTGGGASFQAGSGEGYMTPKAFKKKNKK